MSLRIEGGESSGKDVEGTWVTPHYPGQEAGLPGAGSGGSLQEVKARIPSHFTKLMQLSQIMWVFSWNNELNVNITIAKIANCTVQKCPIFINAKNVKNALFKEF